MVDGYEGEKGAIIAGSRGYFLKVEYKSISYFLIVFQVNIGLPGTCGQGKQRPCLPVIIFTCYHATCTYDKMTIRYKCDFYMIQMIIIRFFFKSLYFVYFLFNYSDGCKVRQAVSLPQ